MDDLSVILLGAAAIAAGVVLATDKRRQTGRATPAGLVYQGPTTPPTQAPAGSTTGRVQFDVRPRTTGAPPYYPISANPVTNILREIGHAGNYPTIQQRRVATNIARANALTFARANPKLTHYDPETESYCIAGFG